MTGLNDVVITGLGVVSPIGIGREAFGESLLAARSGIGKFWTLDDAKRTSYFAASVEDFQGKQFVTPRKALKVMSREVQMAYSAAHLAWQDAALPHDQLQPDRMGVVFGSEMIPGDALELAPSVDACRRDGQYDPSAWGVEFGKQIYPLWMLRNLPNMPACHVGIAVDARGPNNTIAMEEVSSLLAIAEATMIIEREQADLMVVGGIGNRVTPTRQTYRAAGLYDQHPDDGRSAESWTSAFTVGRRGIVPSEGAGSLVLERRSHAVRRGAKILGRVCGVASRCAEPEKRYGGSRRSITSAIKAAVQSAGLDIADIGHVCAQGYGHQVLDIEEAHGIADVRADLPVCVPSSYLGTAGAASGILELSASLLSGLDGNLLPAFAHPQTDEACPIRVVSQAAVSESRYFIKLSFTPFGQSAAVVVECES